MGEKLDVFIDDLDLVEVLDVSTRERHYGEFEIDVQLNDGWHTLRKSKDSRIFGESYAEDLIKKYGRDGRRLTYSFIHNPSLWDDDCGDYYDGDIYYGDGLDCCDELQYMD